MMILLYVIRKSVNKRLKRFLTECLIMTLI